MDIMLVMKTFVLCMDLDLLLLSLLYQPDTIA
jgi:hypothetical protein